GIQLDFRLQIIPAIQISASGVSGIPIDSPQIAPTTINVEPDVIKEVDPSTTPTDRASDSPNSGDSSNKQQEQRSDEQSSKGSETNAIDSPGINDPPLQEDSSAIPEEPQAKP
ncbi:MAG: hypothetical protein K2Z81_14355, partial [Cyanobacteria bacterium]|nr:hypothetical protein [Cyanobacteriota bacterium]